jgi:LysR family transcriptional regulator, glycine cleavage system transcriptional activator
MSSFPSLNALHAFEVTARLRSVSSAARELHVTASAVSHQIKRLEESLGVRLLERYNKQVTLTEAGAAYYQAISSGFEQISRATERLQHNRQQVVSVTTVPPFAIKWLVRRLASFHQRYPDVEVRLGSTYRLLDLRHGEYDLGVRWGQGDWSGLHTKRLMGETIQPVCSPRYLAAAKRLRSPADIHKHKLLSTRVVRGDWRIWADLHGIPPPIVSKGLHFDESLGAIQAAIDGLGVALGPTALVYDDIKGGQLVAPLSDPIRLNEAYFVTYAERAIENPAAISFRDWLVETCEAFERSLPDVARLAVGKVSYPRPDG